MRGTNILLMIAILVSGCSTTTEIIKDPVLVTETIYETVAVPATLLEPCVAPVLDINTNKDLESALAAAIIELQRCTEDKVAISELE